MKSLVTDLTVGDEMKDSQVQIREGTQANN
jgi:hypothetical protein